MIDIAPGEYHFRSPSKRGWYVSNHDDPLPRNVFLPLEGLTNVTIRSPRAEFVFHGEGMAMGIVDSANVVLKGLAFDYSRPFNTEWRFLGFEGGEPLLETDPEKFPFSTEGGKLFTAGENLHVEEVVAEMFGGRDYETVGKDWVGSACERLSCGRIRLKAPLGGYRYVIPPEPGKSVFVMRARKRPNPAMLMYRASDVILEDVIFRSSAGMGLIAQRSENITMRGTGKAAERTCGTFSRADSGRKTTLLADATHFSCCRGQITVENCTFERMMDDAINVHAVGLRVERIVPPSRLVCRFKHPQALGFEVFAPGETLRFIKTRTLENGAEAKIASVCTPSPDIVEIELACRVPEGCVEGDTVENADWQPSVRFAGNMVDRTVARGVLFTTSGKVVCESNVFSHIYGPAIRVSGDSMNWYETGGCRNLAIRGNRFENCRTAYGAGVIAIDPEIADVARQRERYHRGIVIEDNVFETHDVPLVWANSVKGLVWRRNRIVRNDAYRALHRAPLHFEHSEDVSIDGVPAEKHPETTVVPDETLMLLVSGVDEVARMERDLVELSEERGVPLWFGNPHGMLNAALRDGRWRTLLLDEDEATPEKLADIRGRAAPYVEIVIQTRKTNASKWPGLRTVHVGNATGRRQAEIVADTLFPR